MNLISDNRICKKIHFQTCKNNMIRNIHFFYLCLKFPFIYFEINPIALLLEYKDKVFACKYHFWEQMMPTREYEKQINYILLGLLVLFFLRFSIQIFSG